MVNQLRDLMHENVAAASHTNEDLNRDNGQYVDGVTDDGLVLFRDGPRRDQLRPGYALLDPATGEKDWLPDPPTAEGEPARPVDLGTDRLVLSGVDAGTGEDAAPPGKVRMYAVTFDRDARAWRRIGWPDLPALDDPSPALLGPDDRLYVRVTENRGEPPEGGWPTGPDGEADDADAPGDTYRLWSASLTHPSDVRDEELTVGDLAFTATSMVWTDGRNGDSGLVHVRDLTG